MPWDQQVPGIYGNAYFASHALDEERAFEWLTDLRKRRVGWKAASQQLKDYLCREAAGKYANAEHKEYVESELSRAEKYLKPWLLD